MARASLCVARQRSFTPRRTLSAKQRLAKRRPLHDRLLDLTSMALDLPPGPIGKPLAVDLGRKDVPGAASRGVRCRLLVVRGWTNLVGAR